MECRIPESVSGDGDLGVSVDLRLRLARCRDGFPEGSRRAPCFAGYNADRSLLPPDPAKGGTVAYAIGLGLTDIAHFP